MANAKLSRSFYDRPTLTVARELIGARLVRRYRGRRLSGTIVETEAYLGPADVASHASHGPASRAAPMFGPPGHAYIYFTYGMHYCMNVVTEGKDSGTAVLLRAIEPLEGIAAMRRLREQRSGRVAIPEVQLTNGPGKLCQALGLDKTLNEADLGGEIVWIERGESGPARRIATTARIGISNGREHPWRFYDTASRFVSRHPNY